MSGLLGYGYVGFDDMVEQTWRSFSHSDRNGMIRFKKKLQELKKIIRYWIKDKNSQLSCSKQSILKELRVIDKELDQGGISDSSLFRRHELKCQLNDIKAMKATDSLQKSKVRWAIERDKNSKYFHGIINKKRSHLAIRGVFDEGIWLTDPSLVKKAFIDHYGTRFKKPTMARLKLNFSFPNRLSQEQAADLERGVSRDEIRSAVWDCGENKSPGPDGFTFEFFRRYWEFIGPDFCDANVVHELIHRIQLALPSKDAARTCILSKSWLHAWSTIPAIRFCPSVDTLEKQNQRKYMRWIKRTLLRYHWDNLPITSLDLQFSIHTAFRSAYKLIMQAASKSSLKELHLTILDASFTLPDEIFSRQVKPEQEQQIKVQVYAPNLLRYSHASMAMPTLWFLTIPPKQIELSLRLYNPIDELFFLKMREALELSSKFNINILAYGDGVLVPAFNIDDMRTILPFSATIVEELVFFITINSVLWENSLLFDAFFSICHPIYVKTNTELTLRVANYFLSLIGKVYCEIRNPLNGSWVALTNSSLSLLDTTTPRGCIFEFKLREFEFTEFKLSWCSP
ncbi:hypothetical protein Tco_0644401 [Tanacetum coccineum]